MKFIIKSVLILASIVVCSCTPSIIQHPSISIDGQDIPVASSYRDQSEQYLSPGGKVVSAKPGTFVFKRGKWQDEDEVFMIPDIAKNAPYTEEERNGILKRWIFAQELMRKDHIKRDAKRAQITKAFDKAYKKSKEAEQKRIAAERAAERKRNDAWARAKGYKNYSAYKGAQYKIKNTWAKERGYRNYYDYKRSKSKAEKERRNAASRARIARSKAYTNSMDPESILRDGIQKNLRELSDVASGASTPRAMQRNIPYNGSSNNQTAQRKRESLERLNKVKQSYAKRTTSKKANSSSSKLILKGSSAANIKPAQGIAKGAWSKWTEIIIGNEALVQAKVKWDGTYTHVVWRVKNRTSKSREISIRDKAVIHRYSGKKWQPNDEQTLGKIKPNAWTTFISDTHKGKIDVVQYKVTCVLH